MPEWIEPVLRMVDAVLLLVALVILIRNDLRLRKTQGLLAETQEAQAEVNRALDRLHAGAVCEFDDAQVRYVDDVEFGGGTCTGRVERRVISDGSVVRMMTTCDAHALPAVDYVRALARLGGGA